MTSAALNTTLAFAACTTGVLAFGMLLRDLIFGRRNNEDASLSLLPREPKSRIDLGFHRLVQHSGVPFDATTAALIVLGAGIAAGGSTFLATDHLLLAAGGVVLGGLIPLLILNIIRWRRVSVMRKQLPTALQIVSDAVHSGQTLAEACDLVARELKGSLGAEFRHACSQFHLGHTPMAVMDRMVSRVPVPEFSVFATAVMVHQRAGGNLPLLTRRMARAARDRQEVRGHMLAVTAGSRLSAIGMVIGSIIAMVVLGALEPDYIGAFFEHPLGPTLLGVAVGLQFVGILWIWRILRTKF